MAEEQRSSLEATGNKDAGPFLAKIVSHLDPTNMGILEVQLLREVGNDKNKEGQLHQVRYLSPFYGITSVDYNGKDPNDYNNTQKSYGFWMVPPDVGTIVMVIFVEGDPKRGYWIGCVQDEMMNFMVPGYAATQYVDSKSKKTKADRVPVAEYNKKMESEVKEINHYKKPAHPFEQVLDNQGLLKDDIRGITTSSARREVPSAVFGISTPGPLDKRNGAKKGEVGKQEFKVNAFVSRLGGSSFVMDDGDDKFLRKKHPKEGKPEYTSVEQGETGGDVTMPHNELIRIRTRTGHQILLHNSEDLIYIINSRGTAWIELTSNGKIDIYAADSVSLHTKNDLNITADRDINLTAGKNINLNAGMNIFATAAKNYEIKAGADGKLTTGGSSHIKAGGNHIETASKIHMNGPGASPAQSAPICKRVPTEEPWDEHENLDPQSFVPTKTIAVQKKDSTKNKKKEQTQQQKEKQTQTNAKIAKSVQSGQYGQAAMLNKQLKEEQTASQSSTKYTTKIDTFTKIKEPEKKK